ncbi:hypothetical protein LCGC14_0891400 [marine sediment metagenome]|uniref:Uncharacterized protein n=1 Tax=marine sediment metagenome TaxID=412755 RepID=A0A0F9RIH2_9ZZZZ
MAAQELTWDMTQLIQRFRDDTGRSQTTDISDNAIAALVNDYYVNYFGSDTGVDEFNTFFTQALSATDDGVYDLAQNIDRLDDPVTINGNPIEFFRDRELFFTGNHLHGHHHRFSGFLTTLHSSHFHKFEDEQFITAPTLVIGTDTAKVKHSDFDYLINDFAHSKASSEVDLTGDAVPEDKFGAWSFRIDEDGDITVTAAADNATGYLTPRLALEALTSSDSTSAYMGYVTVIKSDGAFTPATTALNASNVTATFTDGRFENRSTPISALLYGQDLYVEPKPNDIYEFKALSISDRPTALDTSDELADPKHGPAVARGSAILYLGPRGGQERIAELAATTKHIFDSIRSDKTKRLLGMVVQRNY